MASGRKNYFRHSFLAHRDEKIVQLIEKFGMVGYAYFWIILELCGEKCENNVPEKFVFHQRTLLTSLLVRKDKLSNYLAVTSQLLLIHATTKGTIIELSIPKFTKYIGLYGSLATFKSCKESKLKESKVKERENEPKKPKALRADYDFEALYKKYPKKEGKKKGIERLRKEIKNIDAYQNCLKAVENYAHRCGHENIEKQYIKQFSTFANDWEDWIDYVPEKTQNQKLVAFFESVGGDDGQH